MFHLHELNLINIQYPLYIKKKKGYINRSMIYPMLYPMENESYDPVF